MDFIYIKKKKQNNETSCNCFKWDGKEGDWEGNGGGDLTSVQCKAIQNCQIPLVQ
jgi:hypothetical protein